MFEEAEWKLPDAGVSSGRDQVFSEADVKLSVRKQSESLKKFDPDHDAKNLASPQEGVEYVRFFQKAVAAAKAVGADRAITNKYAEKLVRHVRETGRLISELPRIQGRRTDRKLSKTDFTKFIESTGITKQTALNWQSLATLISDTLFDEKIESIKADDEATIGLSEFYKLLTQIKRTLKERKRETRREENRKAVETAPSIDQVKGKFSTILIDPPWDWGDEGDQDQLGRARPTYQTMTVEQLRELPVGQFADTDCHIYLWITNRSLPKGFALLDAWGFRYVTCITWAKPSFGMGNYFRGQTEHCLFGVRGSQLLKRKDVGTLFSAPRGKQHSSKPEKFYELIESCSYGPYLEIFARGDRKGWKSWGADVTAAA